MSKRILIALSVVTAFIAVFANAGISRAAGWIDTKKECSITISAEEKLKEHPDLTEAGLSAELYRVGTISNNAVFTATEKFKELDLSSISGKQVTDWNALIEQACGLLEMKDDIYPAGDYSVKIAKGEKQASIKVEQGLYLVCVNPVKTLHHTFTFSPYMASVPSNEAYMSDAGDAEVDAPDTWIYDVVVGLKPEESVRLGELTLEKHLDGYDDTLGNPSFAFQINAWLDEDGDGEEELVYSNVASLTFSEEGTLSATVTGIPSGSRVTVEEIYSGAGYHLTDGMEGRSLVLMPDEDGLVKGTVSFTNTFDGSMKKGGGVVNHYKKHGDGWEWSPAEDSRGLEVSHEEE